VRLDLAGFIWCIIGDVGLAIGFRLRQFESESRSGRLGPGFGSLRARDEEDDSEIKDERDFAD
jgi:hypothetical protein